MKVEKKGPEFRPVVITLETQEELDVLHALVALGGGGYADRFLYKLYNELDKYSSSKPTNYWKGMLTTIDSNARL